jgi:hypothetical protein
MSRATITISRHGPQNYNDAIADSVSLMTQQFLVTHTIRQTDIPASLDSRYKPACCHAVLSTTALVQTSLLSHSSVHNSTGTNQPAVTQFCPQQHWFSLYFYQNIKRLYSGLLIIGQVLSSCCKIVYRKVMTHCYLISHMDIEQVT